MTTKLEIKQQLSDQGTAVSTAAIKRAIQTLELGEQTRDDFSPSEVEQILNHFASPTAPTDREGELSGLVRAANDAHSSGITYGKQAAELVQQEFQAGVMEGFTAAMGKGAGSLGEFEFPSFVAPPLDDLRDVLTVNRQRRLAAANN